MNCPKQNRYAPPPGCRLLLHWEHNSSPSFSQESRALVRWSNLLSHSEERPERVVQVTTGVIDEAGQMGLVGLEPTISPLWAVRFNQLNYKPQLLTVSTWNSRADRKRRPLLYLLLRNPGEAAINILGQALRMQAILKKLSDFRHPSSEFESDR